METQIIHRREKTFLVLAGTFLAAMTLLNVVGLTRFIHIGPLALAVGVLPYPLTFLCTDLISEIYGRQRANFVVWMGLFLNVFILTLLWLGQALPSVGVESQPPWQVLSLAESVALPNGDVHVGRVELFQLIYGCTSGAVLASMVAYMTAQFCDVTLFHYLKKKTHGKHLWLRNNGSTLVSQLVDSLAVISITFGAAFLKGEYTFKTILVLLGSNYLFKMVAALGDTIPFYVLVKFLRRFLRLKENEEVPSW